MKKDEIKLFGRGSESCIDLFIYVFIYLFIFLSIYLFMYLCFETIFETSYRDHHSMPPKGMSQPLC